MTFGEILDKDVLILREVVGDAELDGIEYELTTTMTRSPLVKSKLTGKTFTISWRHLIEMAIKAGLDEE